MADIYQAVVCYQTISSSRDSHNKCVRGDLTHLLFSGTSETKRRENRVKAPTNPIVRLVLEPLGGAAGVQLNPVYSDNYKSQ